jgi:hypothetical protein
LDDPEFKFPAEATDFSLLQIVQNDYGNHPPSYSIDNGVSPWVKETGA